MAKILKATKRQQANRNKIILDRLVEEHPGRTHPTAMKQLPSDADEQSYSSLVASTVKPKIDVHLEFIASRRLLWRIPKTRRGDKNLKF